MMRRTIAASLLFVLSACGRTGSMAAHDPESTGGSSAMPPAGGGASGISGTSGAGGTAGKPTPTDCEHPHPGAAPLSLLANEEIGLSLEALLGQADQAQRLPAEEPVRSASRQFVGVMHEIAHATAQAVVTDDVRLRAVLDCSPTTGAEACEPHFIERFLRQAFRRPATPEERDEMADVFARGLELGGNFESGVRAVIEVTLQSPEFLYLVELGSGPVDAGVVRLTPFEAAARLSFFLTGGPPDAELSAAAEQNRLQEGDGLEEQLSRLVGSAANRDHVHSFYRKIYWLENDGVAEIPAPAEILAFARQETRMFIDDATFGIGTYRALLTEPATWLNEPLARFYGYDDVTGQEFRKVQLDPAKRAGLFTQQAFLDASSFTNRAGTIARGSFVLNQLLCLNLAPDPAVSGVVTPPEVPPGATWREQLTASTSAPECAGCHANLNPAGFAFEHYDSVGRYRTLDAGQPIDASGTLLTTDAAGSFRDATELLQHIAESEDGQACFVGHWQQHAYRRSLAPEDGCAEAALARSFRESDGNVPQLMMAIAQSDRFKYRLASELSP